MITLIATLLSLSAFAHEPGAETEGKPFTPRCEASFLELKGWAARATQDSEKLAGEQCMKQVDHAKKIIPHFPTSCRSILFSKMPESFRKSWLEKSASPADGARLGDEADTYQKRVLTKLNEHCKGQQIESGNAKMTGLQKHLRESRAIPHASPDPK